VVLSVKLTGLLPPRTMLDIVNGIVPVFVSVTVCVALVACAAAVKVKLDELSETVVVGLIVVPTRLIVSEPALVLSVIVSVALSVPTTVSE
jgi:hypothetical protein